MTARADAGMAWTEERIDLLTKLWAEGLSASQIAAEAHDRLQLDAGGYLQNRMVRGPVPVD